MANDVLTKKKSRTRTVLLCAAAALCVAVLFAVWLLQPKIPHSAEALAGDSFDVVLPQPVAERKLRLSFNTLYALPGESYTLTASSFYTDDTQTADVFLFYSSDEAVATVDAQGSVSIVGEGECVITARVADEPIFYSTVKVCVGDYKYYGGYTFIQGILVVNKQYSLPESYTPGLLSETETAFAEMKAAAAADGITLWYYSGYRSYSYQQALLDGYTRRDGLEKALTYCAPAGCSEHQSGMALDVNSFSYSFGETAAGKWLADNSWKYGFILRYADGKQEITQYNYEPWHFRWIGKESAALVYESGLSLEEYLGIDFGY